MFQRRVSKFRHLYASPSKKDQWYEGIRATTNAHDSNFCEVNPKFFAVVTESTGGGVFLVLPLSQTGRQSHIKESGKVTGHRGTVTDIKWSPFDDNVIASCSDDATVKVWTIPDEGLSEPLEYPTYNLQGHLKRVSRLEWHPLVSGVLLSAAMDYRCIVWNVQRQEVVYTICVHPDVIFSISWSPCGRYFASTCKDRRVRVIDPRKGVVVEQGEGHQGTKSSKVVFVASDRVFTTGFSRMSERQYSLWDTSDLSKPLKTDNVDCSSGILIPYFDRDTNVMFLAGKGDGNIRFYKISSTSPYVHFLNQYLSNMPQRGLGQMCKRGVDVRRCEVARFYKLHTNKDICEPLSMIVPRKSEVFQSDLFPPTNSFHSNISPAEWFNGVDREADKMDLKFESPSTTLPPLTESRNPSRGEELDGRIGMTWGGGGGFGGNYGGYGEGRFENKGHSDSVDGGKEDDDLKNGMMKVMKENGLKMVGDGVVMRRGMGDGVGVNGGRGNAIGRRVVGEGVKGNTSAGPTPKLPASLRNIHRLSTAENVVNLGPQNKHPTSFKNAFYNIGYSSRVGEKDPEDQSAEVERLRGELLKRNSYIGRLEKENMGLKRLIQNGGSIGESSGVEVTA